MMCSKALYLVMLVGFTVLEAKATTINFTGEDPGPYV